MLFKANSLLNLSCPRRYVGRGPDMMIVVFGRCAAYCLDQAPEVPHQCFRLPQLGVVNPSVKQLQRLQHSHHPSGSRVSAQKHRLSLRWSQRHIPSHIEERSGYGRRYRRPGPGSHLPLLHPGSWVSRRRSEGHLGRSRHGCTGPVQRNTRSRGGGSVSNALHTYPGLGSISPGCFQRCFPFPPFPLVTTKVIHTYK